MKDLAILIPARYNSSRFPGKMLEVFDGVPLVRRVYDICASTGIDTYVLTDDERIAAVSPNSIITSKECKNGTERCAEVVDKLNYTSFVNVQGDMVDINQTIIHKIANKTLYHKHTKNIVSLHTSIGIEDQKNPSAVKVIHTGELAHWFCRASLAYGSRRVGVYGYNYEALKAYKELNIYPEETTESLEQLRWIQNGYNIYTYEVDFKGFEINTPEDAYRWRESRNKKA